MTFKGFHLKLYFRLFLLLLNFISIAFFLVDRTYYVLPVGLFAVAVIQAVELTYFVKVTNRSLAKFLQDVNFQDVSAGYGLKKYGGSFKALEDTYKVVLEKMKDISHEKESYLELLNSIVEQIDVGLLVVDEKNDVRLMNSIASSFLGAPNYRKWERFRERLPQFTDFVEQLEVNESAVLKMNFENEELSLSITRTQIVQLHRQLDIVTLVSIGSHLGQKEVESYNRLISVLTHEIMNTVSPIVSLSKVVEQKLADHTDEDVRQSIQIIGDRSEGLLNFVRNYRKISKIPHPNLEYHTVSTLLSNVQKLMESSIKPTDSIEVNCSPESLEILIDKNLIEQCLINLVKNAIEARSHDRPLIIEMKAFQKAGKKYVEVIDNGAGIPPEIQSNILVPFFTSKAEGTGIGLSIVNQIMMKHSGSLHFTSSPGKTSFSLIFG